MKFIIGTKVGMTQVFDQNGVCHAATVLRVSPSTVTSVKSVDTDGYAAVQIASGAQKEHRVAKAQKGQFGGSFQNAKEFRPRKNYAETVDSLKKGETIDASVFSVGDLVVVSGISKGKGFQGGVKRHNFRGGSATHGQKHSEREPGSIGATGTHVLKGTRMAGRMGSDKITVKNLRVLQVNTEANLLLLAGAVPGRKGTLVEVRNV
jgi:large subunit ribosomal protein L3